VEQDTKISRGAGVDESERAVRERVDALEAGFGPVDDPDNPLGREALLAADEHWEVLAGAERLLAEHGIGAEVVPVAEGGKLDRLDALGRILRPIFRRDPSIGFGCVLACHIAAAPVWIAGTPAQRRRIAELLTAGERVAVVRRGEAHAHDFVRDEFTLEQTPDGPVLTGEKSAIANSDRASALVVFARIDEAHDAHSHSMLLIEREDLGDLIEDLPRYATVGMHGCWFGGLAVLDAPVPPDSLVGAEGGAIELSLRASLLIRGPVASSLIACGDTALRIAIRCAIDHSSARGGSGAEAPRIPQLSPHDIGVLCGAFLDLLVGDCLALAASRAAHLIPERMSACAAAAAYIVPKLLADTADDLTVILGDGQYMKQGAYGLFQKQLRDMSVPGLGHSGSAGRQATIIPQLPLFADRSWFHGEQPPAGLFSTDRGLPPLDFSRLAALGESDPLAAALLSCARFIAADDSWARDREQAAALCDAVDQIVGELDQLRKACAELAVQGRTALVTPHSYALADRYAFVCAAAACLGVWREQQDAGDPFLADAAWVIAALVRIGRLLGLPVRPGPKDGDQRIVAEVFARYHEGLSYDLYRSVLAA
jgi:alkylation response protein AidB-like acyl-CoA dehydrogenase